MGKQTPTPPTPVDPVALSQAQGTANKDTAITSAELNAVNSNSPFGSVSYTQTPNPSDPSVPQFTATTSLSPEQQQLYNTQTGIEQQAYNTGATALNNVQSTLNQPFSLNGLPALQTSVNSNGPNVPLTAADFAQQGQDTTNALMQRFNTEWDKQNAANDAQLANQGIGLGSAAYAADKLNLNQAKNDAIGQALLAGNQEQNTLFGQSLASNQNAWQQALQNASLNNQGRQQMISEQELLRSQPINEIATLLGLGPGLQSPIASPNFGINVSPTDVIGAYGLNQQGQQYTYGQQMAANNAVTGALGNMFGALGSAAIMHSDRRLKTNISLLGKTPRGIPLYSFTYRNAPHKRIVGVMAQDMAGIDPLAVHIRNGFMAVDYGRVM